jgi:hypothetical protein
MRVVIALALAASLSLSGCSQPNQASYAMRRSAPLAHPTYTSLAKPHVVHVKTVSKARPPIQTVSQVANSTTTKPSPLPVKKSTEAPSVPPTASVAPSPTTRHYLVADTVGNCSVIDSKPSDGLKGVGEKNGYASKDLANEAMKHEPKCGGGQTSVEQDSNAKFKAAEAKAKKVGGVHNLTREDIEGLTYQQIKELRGY